MSDKQKLLQELREEFGRWEELLASMSEDQITAPQLPATWSTKDEIAHLMAWQQVSSARLEAALLNQEPDFPTWLRGLDPESEDHLDEFNARIYETYREQPWSSVHRSWRKGFLRLLNLAEAVPDEDMTDAARYPWLKGYALSAVLEGSCKHHHEHRESHRLPGSGTTGT
jgi:hypothetical protein